MIEVIDNFLSPSYFRALQDMVCSNFFPWSYRGDVTRAAGENLEQLGALGFDYGLIHRDSGALRDSQEAQMAAPCLYQIKDFVECAHVLKARYDMTVYNPDKFRHDPHIDLDHPDFVSTILYMNETDGETLIYEEMCYHTDGVDPTGDYVIKKSIEPKPNRLLIFDGHHLHTGHSPSKHKKRVLLNSVYGKEINYE